MSDFALTNSATSSPAPLTDPTEEAARQITDIIDDSWLKGQTYVKQYPLHSVAYAFGAGLLLGVVWAGLKACGSRKYA